MRKYVMIVDNQKCTLKLVFIFEIPFYWLYCKIKGYDLYIYERRDLN